MIIHDVDQNTKEWWESRIGIPTASDFSKLITSTGEPSKSMSDYAAVLAGNRYAKKSLDSWQGNYHTERGHEIEPEARNWYSFAYADVVQTGFITDDTEQYGCSPDGLVNDDGLVEFKCLSAKEHVKALLYFNKHKKCPTTYVQQTQGQMFICERKWCDLVFYHPDLPKLRIRQLPDSNIIAGLKNQLDAVIKERDRILTILNQFD
ncbi:MAG: YqaJ viral recombinase family protein [Gammaproteobacteria bacterium]|nr:YqaJ viral recombinase family protein [Gammaproteobacteria bacterium]